MTRSRITLSLMALLAIVMNVDTKAEILQSTFNTGTEGWTHNTDGSTQQWISAGGNPGGYIRLNDSAAGVGMNHFAPAKFLGDLRTFDGGTISYDFRVIIAPQVNNDPFAGNVFISSPNDTANLDLIPGTPTSAWTNYSAPLNADAWGKTPSEWEALLSNVTQIRIAVELGANSDSSGFDNFTLTPEPTSVALLGIGGSLLMLRRRVA